jgi:hypothetical protein
MKRKTGSKPAETSAEFAAKVGRALRRAGRAARKKARMYGTPVYIPRNGRIIAEKP